AYLRLLDRLGDDWRKASDQATPSDADPAELLRKLAQESPHDVRKWREYSRYLSSHGDMVGAHLALARGYYYAGSLGIVQGKLELARKESPEDPRIREIENLLK